LGHDARSPPPDIIAAGSASILSFLSQLLKGQERCYRIKLMFVGQENVGYCLLPAPPPHALYIKMLSNVYTTGTGKRRCSRR
jgi:hypothetical protein